MKQGYWRGLGVVLILLGLLPACGGEEETAPSLVALPTRTSVPATQTPEDAPAAPESTATRVEVRSMVPEISAFLAEAETVSAFDRIDVFSRDVLIPAADCVASSLWPNVAPLEIVGSNINLVTVPLDVWQASVESLPEAELMRRLDDSLAQAQALLPPVHDLRVCVMPVPEFGPLENVPNHGLGYFVLGGDLVVVTCSAGELCLKAVPYTVPQFYGYAYQAAVDDRQGIEFSLLDMVIMYGRANALALSLEPEGEYLWAAALTPEQEVDLWGRMQEYLNAYYTDYPAGRRIDDILYGSGTGHYPAWGGIYIGTQIALAYQSSHPEVSFSDLFAFPPDVLLAESGYTPGPPA